MAGYIGTKAVFLSTTAASVGGNATIGGDLNVGTIKDATGTNTAITIDSSGRVSLPNRVAGGFKKAAVQTIPNTTATKVELDTAMFNDNLIFDSSTNYRVTVPVDGIYLVQAGVTFLGGVDSAHCGIYLNGGNDVNKGLAENWTQQGDYANSSTQVSQLNNRLLKLDANDYLELYAYHSSGGSFNINQNRTFFSVVKLA